MLLLEGLTKSYDYSSIKGIFDIDVAFPPGQVTALLGENGAGKSTLLRCTMGLDRVDAGEVLLYGKKLDYNKIAFATEEGSFIGQMSPREYGVFLADFFDGFLMERYEKLLDFFQLDADGKSKTFSTGQRAKLEIAAAFSKGAHYILMDEPFLGKDMFTRREFLKLMSAFLTEKDSVILCTHMIDEIETYVDRVVVMKDGRIVGDALLEEIQENGQDLKAFYTEKSGYEKKEFNF